MKKNVVMRENPVFGTEYVNSQEAARILGVEPRQAQKIFKRLREAGSPVFIEIMGKGHGGVRPQYMERKIIESLKSFPLLKKGE